MNVLLVWPKFESFSFWHFEKVCQLAGDDSRGAESEPVGP
jgi:hypothetical protein